MLSEPGGKSSVHLGWDSPKNSKPPTTAVVSKEEKENLMKVIGSAALSESVKRKDQNQHPSQVGGRGISSNAYATGSSQNVGNVLTDRPTSRVTQPPGGYSSISFC